MTQLVFQKIRALFWPFMAQKGGQSNKKWCFSAYRLYMDQRLDLDTGMND